MKIKPFHIIILFVLSLIINNPSYSQISIKNEYPDTVNKKRLRTVLISQSAVYVSGLSYLQYVWYKDHEPVPFHFYNDNRGWLQMDKLSHSFFAYHEAGFIYNTFRWSGLGDKKSIFYSGLISILMQTPVEIFDGLYEGYGFSAGDIIANTSGTALFCMQQVFLDKQIAGLKFSYSPSAYPKYHPWYLGDTPVESFFQDYNGQTTWLSVNLKGLFPKSSLPTWLNFAVGYSGNGMLAEFKNPPYYLGEKLPDLERYRQYIFSIDMDLTKIKTRSKFLKNLFSIVNVLKIPAPALEYNRVDGFRIHGLYY